MLAQKRMATLCQDAQLGTPAPTKASIDGGSLQTGCGFQIEEMRRSGLSCAASRSRLICAFACLEEVTGGPVFTCVSIVAKHVVRRVLRSISSQQMASRNRPSF